MMIGLKILLVTYDKVKLLSYIGELYLKEDIKESMRYMTINLSEVE